MKRITKNRIRYHSPTKKHYIFIEGKRIYLTPSGTKDTQTNRVKAWKAYKASLGNSEAYEASRGSLIAERSIAPKQGKASESPTIKQSIKGYLRIREADMKSGFIGANQYTKIAYFFKVFQKNLPQNIRYLRDIDESILSDFKLNLIQHGYSSSTINPLLDTVCLLH